MKRCNNLFHLLGWLIVIVCVGVFLFVFLFEKEKTTAVKIFGIVCYLVALTLVVVMKRFNNLFHLLGWLVVIVGMGIFLFAFFFEKEKTPAVMIFETVCCFAALILFEVGDSKKE